ncbi:hypothetical protein LguiB_031494 [Lonicera macranthoides]
MRSFGNMNGTNMEFALPSQIQACTEEICCRGALQMKRKPDIYQILKDTGESGMCAKALDLDSSEGDGSGLARRRPKRSV